MATPPPPAVVAEMRIALALAASASAARWPFTSDPLDFWAGGGKLFVSSGAASARLHLKGVSWFGFETSTACVHELWAHTRVPQFFGHARVQRDPPARWRSTTSLNNRLFLGVPHRRRVARRPRDGGRRHRSAAWLADARHAPHPRGRVADRSRAVVRRRRPSRRRAPTRTSRASGTSTSRRRPASRPRRRTAPAGGATDEDAPAFGADRVVRQPAVRTDHAE